MIFLLLRKMTTLPFLVLKEIVLCFPDIGPRYFFVPDDDCPLIALLMFPFLLADAPAAAAVMAASAALPTVFTPDFVPVFAVAPMDLEPLVAEAVVPALFPPAVTLVEIPAFALLPLAVPPLVLAFLFCVVDRDFFARLRSPDAVPLIADPRTEAATASRCFCC